MSSIMCYILALFFAVGISMTAALPHEEDIVPEAHKQTMIATQSTYPLQSYLFDSTNKYALSPNQRDNVQAEYDTFKATYDGKDWAQCVKGDCADNFKQLMNGQCPNHNCGHPKCPDGFDPITDMKTCETAVAALGGGSMSAPKVDAGWGMLGCTTRGDGAPLDLWKHSFFNTKVNGPAVLSRKGSPYNYRVFCHKLSYPLGSYSFDSTKMYALSADQRGNVQGEYDTYIKKHGAWWGKCYWSDCGCSSAATRSSCINKLMNGKCPDQNCGHPKCPDGYNMITDMKTCETAVAALGGGSISAPKVDAAWGMLGCTTRGDGAAADRWKASFFNQEGREAAVWSRRDSPYNYRVFCKKV